MNNKQLYKGTIESYIFQLLELNNRMYGYQISKEIKELTNGQMELPESKLYPTLHKMEAAGLLETEMEQVGSRLRKYYRLTQKGKTESRLSLENLKEYISHLNTLLNLKPATSYA